MFLIFMSVIKNNGCACSFCNSDSGDGAAHRRRLRHRGAKHSTTPKTNVRRAVTRRAYRVLGQDRATIGGQICLRDPAAGAGAAIRGEDGQSARGVSRGGAGNPRLRGERKPTCSPLVTSFASGISYGKFARGAGWWSSWRVPGGLRGRNERGGGP